MIPGVHLIGDRWLAGEGPPFQCTNPASGAIEWDGRAATEGEIDRAVAASRAAVEGWSVLPIERRIECLERFADQLRAKRESLADAISRQTGKPRWEALSEVDAMIGKVPLSVAAHRDRRHETASQSGGILAATRYKPFGVLAVVGPYNMPGHLPNGHIVPALLAGNSVVFKPSEFTSLVGQRMAELWQAAGLPAGVLSLLHGGRETGAGLVRHPQIDGVLFTGSVAGGVAIGKTLADQPGKIVALEMGGNNPLVVWDAADLDAAAYLTIQSAFITSGQRCSCARRLIVADNDSGVKFIDRLLAMTRTIRVGAADMTPEPFMGPVISDGAAENLLSAQTELHRKGGTILAELRVLGTRTAMLSPGIMDVTDISTRPDTEFFGPFLQVIRVPDFEVAVAQANQTRFGLAAGLLSDNAALWTAFYSRIRAGVVYFNRQTTGGSSALPFGGVGQSGNHRPSGYFAADYCSYPVASMESPSLKMPEKRTPGIG